MATKIYDFVVKDPATSRDDILRTIRNGLISRGVSNPNVSPKSDYYVLATAVANELAVAGANCIIAADDLMPDTATGEELERIGAIFGLSKQGAAGSVGSGTISSSATTSITTGQELLDGAGLRYKATVGGTYGVNATISIAAVDTGKATNLAAGTVLRWIIAPPFCDEKVTIAAGGLTNGIDAEDDEVFRARILAYLQTPPGSGNWEHVAELAEAASASVQKAFVYPAAQGAGTFHVACCAAPTTTSKSRVVASATISGTISPYVKGKVPEHTHSVITTVADVNADVAFGITIPDAPTAIPPGGGGGWTNGTPWPTPDASTTFRCTVTAVASTTQFTVDAVTAPTINVSRICWLSPTEWKLYSALVTAVSGVSGAYVITIDTPFVGITTGCYIWPEAQNAQLYVDAVLDAFALMGPGEKTSNASLLTRAFRHPRPGTSWPSTLGGHLLSSITAAQSEVSSAQFFHRTDGTTTVTGNAGVVTPQLPASINDAPKQFVPRHIGFYRIP